MKNKLILTGAALIAAAAAVTSASASERATKDSDLEILKTYAEDFETDRFFQDSMIFGVNVGSDWYTVEGSPGVNGAAGSMDVRTGAPSEPTFYFKIESSEILQKIAADEVSALTLAGKAQSADYAPMDIELMDDATLPPWFGEKITRLLFHFWTRGWPEIVPFSTQETRLVHSADLAALYYQPGFRSAYFNMEPGRHANDGEGEEAADPYTSMFILLDGELRVLLDDKEVQFKAGTMMIVPPGVRHELINDGDVNAVGFVLMFGEGA